MRLSHLDPLQPVQMGEVIIKSLRLSAIGFAILTALQASPALSQGGGHDTYAFNLFNRIVGIAPSDEEMSQMSALLKKGKTDEAINIALNSAEFYDVRLSPWIKYWFNENDTNRVDLNDGVATVIGVIRDDLPFNTLLTDDILYVGDNSKLGATPLPDASVENNNHYRQMESRGLGLKDTLVKTTQSEYYNINPDEQEIAGVFTTRSFAEAYYIDGTNRAAFKYTIHNFFCKDMEDLHDTSTPTFGIRQDVTRAPAGDPSTFVNTCQGCHSGMDALSGAFAHFDFDDDKLVYNTATLQPDNANSAHKYHINATNFPQGFRTKDNGWINLWAEGQNSALGWRGPKEGKGVKEFGELISSASQFSSCMSEQVFELLCLHSPKTDEEKEAVRNISYRFEAQGSYSMKQVFRDTAKFCVNR